MKLYTYTSIIAIRETQQDKVLSNEIYYTKILLSTYAPILLIHLNLRVLIPGVFMTISLRYHCYSILNRMKLYNSGNENGIFAQAYMTWRLPQQMSWLYWFMHISQKLSLLPMTEDNGYWLQISFPYRLWRLWYIVFVFSESMSHEMWIYRSRLVVIFYCYYNDITMNAMASQITSLTIVYSTVYSRADQRKHQSSASLAFVWGIHRSPVNSPHKGPVTQKMFPFDDVIMAP